MNTISGFLGTTRLKKLINDISLPQMGMNENCGTLILQNEALAKSLAAFTELGNI